MLKATGVVRKVDDLGRIVIPMELRRTLEINNDDALEIYTDNEKIILRKYHPGCIFCSNVENVLVFSEQYVCGQCLTAIKEMAG